MLFIQFAAALAMYIIAQQRVMHVDGVMYVAPPPPPRPFPAPSPASSPGSGLTPPPPPPPPPPSPIPAMPVSTARRLLQQSSQEQQQQQQQPELPPLSLLPPPPATPPPAPSPPANTTAAGSGRRWACLFEMNPSNTGVCGGITVLWWWSFAMVVPLCLGPIISTATSSSRESTGSYNMGCLVSGPVFIGMLSLIVVYGITGTELDRAAQMADAAGIPGAAARQQVLVCCFVGLLGGILDTGSSMWCTWTGLRSRRALAPLAGLLFPLWVLSWPLRRVWRSVREPVLRGVRECCVCCLAAASCLPESAVKRLAAAEQERRGREAELVVVEGRKVCFGEWDGYVRGTCAHEDDPHGAAGSGGGGGDGSGGGGVNGAAGSLVAVADEITGDAGAGHAGGAAAVQRRVVTTVAVVDTAQVKVEVSPGGGEASDGPAGLRPARGRLRGRMADIIAALGRGPLRRCDADTEGQVSRSRSQNW
ncbi:hypothetical protein HYH02_009010 [Chlamydomonas schloesseri]|uniref:Uncharacterized protein n=1 Tax=Chlamydomonas schloesseri TaxID=2026947 RepID=A0A836B0P5_9CHLO|nr:hypothetical protein HYH02_009010 [Chlamydomonas schloesseri]|eukprot:KAG2444067.1 hypothetical protein HYH02_009010 [Chlamydomonas schloesseri]